MVLTVIEAVPGDFATTTPVDVTSATEVLSEDHVTDLSVASSGVTAAFRVRVSPSVIDRVALSRLTPETDIFLDTTVTRQVAVIPPSCVLTEIFAMPGTFATTSPAEETVATVSLSDDQIIVLSVALPGDTVAARRILSPSVNSTDVWLNVTPVTAIVSGSFWQESTKQTTRATTKENTPEALLIIYNKKLITIVTNI